MEEEQRRSILRRASLYVYGLAAAALLSALAGSALIAWLVLPELDFRLAWLAVFAIVVAGVAIIAAVQHVIERWPRDRGSRN